MKYSIVALLLFPFLSFSESIDDFTAKIESQQQAWHKNSQAFPPIKTCVEAYQYLNGTITAISKENCATVAERLKAFDLLFAIQTTETSTKTDFDPRTVFFFRKTSENPGEIHEQKHVAALYVMKKGVKAVMKIPTLTNNRQDFLLHMQKALSKHLKHKFPDYQTIASLNTPRNLEVIFPENFSRKAPSSNLVRSMNFLETVGLGTYAFKLSKIYYDAANTASITHDDRDLRRAQNYKRVLDILEPLMLLPANNIAVSRIQDWYSLVIRDETIDGVVEEIQSAQEPLQPLNQFKKTQGAQETFQVLNQFNDLKQNVGMTREETRGNSTFIFMNAELIKDRVKDLNTFTDITYVGNTLTLWAAEGSLASKTYAREIDSSIRRKEDVVGTILNSTILKNFKKIIFVDLNQDTLDHFKKETQALTIPKLFLKMSLATPAVKPPGSSVLANKPQGSGPLTTGTPQVGAGSPQQLELGK